MRGSPGSIVVWRTAVQEAVRSSNKFIEPEHLAEAMIREYPPANGGLFDKLNVEANLGRELDFELSVVPNAVKALGIDVAKLRRTIRSALANELGQSLSNSSLQPGETVPFLIVLENPPNQIKEVTVTVKNWSSTT